MGMMLRRHKRKGEDAPQVNGKPIKKEPKSQTLTNVKLNPSTPTATSTQR